MITRTERIDSQCPCGVPLAAFIFHFDDGPPRLRLYAKADKLVRITRCPNAGCKRDFSKLTIDQVKERSWGS